MRGLLLVIISAVAAAAVSFYKPKEFVPPGTVQISHNMYFDRDEVTCLSWVEFQFWTRNMYGSNSAEYKFTLIDTTNWDEHSLKTAWHNAKPLALEMRNLPVVGVSYEQAIAFCKWRTERVKYFLSVKNSKSKIDFEYRLPTEKEWEFVSDGSGEVFSNKAAANLKWQDNIESKLLPVETFKPNLHGIYDLTGNAAEMLLEKNIAKGGSWKDSPEDSRNGKKQHYTKASPWLGFRCVCEIKDNN